MHRRPLTLEMALQQLKLAHAAHEHVITESFPRRVALFAGLLVDC